MEDDGHGEVKEKEEEGEGVPGVEAVEAMEKEVWGDLTDGVGEYALESESVDSWLAAMWVDEVDDSPLV